MSKKRKSKEKAAAAGSSRDNTAEVSIKKRKHNLANKRQHTLLPQLQAQSEKQPAVNAREKARKKRAGTSIMAGAMDGIRATLDELLVENERRHKDAAAVEVASSKAALTSKKRQKMVAVLRELAQWKEKQHV